VRVFVHFTVRMTHGIPPCLVSAVVCAALGISLWLFLPTRAGFFPPINEGEPTSWAALKAVLNREQYGKPSVFDNPTYAPGAGNPGHTVSLYWAQIMMWWQYFTWQWGHDWNEGLRRGLAVVFGSLGLLGAWRHWKADKRSALAITSLMFTFTLLLIF